MSDIKHVTKYSRTQVDNDEYWTDTITWTVQDFLKIVAKRANVKLYSEESEIRNLKLPETRFRLKIMWSGRTKDIKIYYFLPTPTSLRYEVRLNSEDGQVIAQQSDHRIVANKWLYLATVSHKDIIGDSIKTNTFFIQPCSTINNHKLLIVFKFKVSFNDIQVNHLDKLSDDFGKLFCDGLFSDVTMKSVDGPEYKVHKAVLASRSAVLKAHFAHNTTEKYTNTIESPFEEEVLKEVLTFIYSNKAPKAGEMPDKLLEAADYYQLDGLKQLCTPELYARLTAENALDTLQLADRYHADSLKQLTLLFIKDRAGKTIKENGGWAKVESVTLLKYTCDWFMEDHIDAEEVNE